MIELGTNPLNGLSQARQPRGIITVNGIPIPFEKIEVNTNTYYVADTFSAEIPANYLPVGLEAVILSQQSTILVDIFAGFPSVGGLIDVITSAGLPELFYGQVDTFDYEPSEGIIRFKGRDLSSRFIDNKTTEKFTNQTSSQIATTLANRRGLTPHVTATSTKAGKYYEIDHARLTKEMSEWDLLTYLAREEDFVVFVKGQTLYFIPAPNPSQLPYIIQYNPQILSGGSILGSIGNIGSSLGGSPISNVVDLRLSRNLTLANDVIVNVRSWNQKNGKAYTKTATATHTHRNVLKGAAQPTGAAQVYNYTFPNLTPEQALQKAQQLLKDISQHEMRMSVTIPGDNILDKSQIIQLIGTGTVWDQVYYPDNIQRTMSAKDGYSMSVTWTFCDNRIE